ncbi:MAG: DUF2089 domain-containing protein [Archangiaceae bacterium]|nr:DUF2089 domain-containing protein [Archangiaceae bacterium]
MIENAHLIPPQCPVCSRELYVEKVRCGTCGTAVEGRFGLDWPARLSREQLNFVRVFVTCGGKIKDVEQALGISYPTVVSRLDEVIAKVAAPELTASPQGGTRREVLERLARGELDAKEAERLLKGAVR